MEKGITNSNKTILSLFDYTGNWSLPYRENGYEVIQIDVKLGQNILDWDYKSVDSVYGILCAPPCTHFSSSGARWWRDKDADGRTEEHLRLIDKTLEIIDYFNPVFWVLENPVGRLYRLRPQLGEPWYFDPYEFGDPYTKKTGLWGKFSLPKKNPVKPIRVCEQGSWVQRLGGKSERTKTLRSATPMGFAYAFYNANR